MDTFREAGITGKHLGIVREASFTNESNAVRVK
jgi:hypothetical protein